jgi:hypothetical protein
LEKLINKSCPIGLDRFSEKIASSIGVAAPFFGEKKFFFGGKKQKKNASSAPGYIRWS